MNNRSQKQQSQKKGAKKDTSKSPYVLLISIFWGIVFLGIVFFAGIMYTISKGALGELPSFKQLENPDNALASEVYSADGVLLGKYYSENRSNADFENLPPHLVKALLATEDIRFYQHSGIDFRGLARVLVRTVLLQQSAGGGSTITQQLAKNLFHDIPGSTLERIIQKLKEWVIAVRLEKYYTKKEIITMYLNTVTFSHNAYGIRSASQTYFSKPIDSLNVQESAVLVGMLRAPTALNPKSNYDNSLERRNVVLHQMAKYDVLKEEVADSLQNLPIDVRYKRTDHIKGLAPYFREILRMELRQWCKEYEKVDGSHYNLYRDGLEIHTTINAKMQKHAEAAVKEHMKDIQQKFFEEWEDSDPWKDHPDALKRKIEESKRYQTLKDKGWSRDSIMANMRKKRQMTVFSYEGEKDTVMSAIDSIRYHRMFLQSGFLVTDPQTGKIKAWVGGINYQYFKYDHINRKTKRQIGSTFKPFVYTEAIDNGYSPCYQVLDVPVTFENFNNWTPKNASGKFSGDKYTLKEGMANSKNSVTAYLMKQIGPQPVIDRIRKMGITSHIPAVPAIALGTPDISLHEMVGAYTTYANSGVFTKPKFIARIEDKSGNLIKSYYAEKREALGQETAHVMLKMLQHVVNDGTAIRLRYRYNIEGEIGGKTGTTQNQSDGWFIGFTPELVGGAWVGGEDRFMRFKSLKYGQGASLALPIWAKFFKRIYNDQSLKYSPEATFDKPDTEINIELDCSKYQQDNKQTNPSNSYGSQYRE